jgi:hypothetical protein
MGEKQYEIMLLMAVKVTVGAILPNIETQSINMRQTKLCKIRQQQQ